jgi:hypothetical protein
VVTNEDLNARVRANNFARELAALSRRLDSVERSAQAGFTSVENASIDVYDGDGNLAAQVGQSLEMYDTITGDLRASFGPQADGAVTLIHFNPTPPAAPTTPIVTPAVASVSVAWDGTWAGGVDAPSDFDSVEVHASPTEPFTADDTTVIATITSATGGTVTYTPDNYSTLSICLTGKNSSGVRGPESAHVSTAARQVVASDVVDGIIDETKLAAGAVQAANIAVGAVTSVAIQDGAVLEEALHDAAVSVAKVQDGAISTAKIQAGAVVAATIAAGAITTDKLTVGSGNNLLADPSFEGAYSAALVATDPGNLSIDATGNGSAHSLKMNAAAGGGNRLLTILDAPAASADQLYLAIDYKVSGDWAGDSVRFYAMFLDGTGAALGYVTAIAGPPTNDGGWHRITAQGSAPAGTVRVQAAPQSFNSTAGTVWFDNAVVLPVLPGTQIQGGAIQTQHMVANTIDGGVIAAGTLDAGKIVAASITATQVKALSLTGDRLAANTITAGQIATGGITADRLSVGTGSNVLPDPSFDGVVTAAAITAAANPAFTQDLTTTNSSLASLKCDATAVTATTRTFEVTRVAVLPGDQWYCATDYKVSSAWAGNTVKFYLRWETATGTILGYSVAQPVTITAGGTWQRITKSGTAPATAARAVILAEAYQATAGTVWFDNAEVRPVLPGTQIQNGAITTAHIQAGTIAADKLTLGSVSGNLVANGGFEDLALSSWAFSVSDGTCSAHVEIATGGFGARSGQGKGVLGATGAGWAKAISNTFPVAAGQTYMFRYWYAGNGVMQVRFETTPDGTTWTDQLAGANNQTLPAFISWTEDTAEVVIPAGATQGRISFTNNNPGGASISGMTYLGIDDVMVMQEGNGAADLSGAGLRLFAPDGSLATELTSANAHATFAGGAAKIDPNGVGAFNSLFTPLRPATASPDDPTGQFWYQGQELSTLLWNMPWGVVTYERAWTQQPSGSTGFTGETGLIELQFQAVEGRMYRMHAESVFDFTGGTGTQGLECQLLVSGTSSTLNGCQIITPNGVSPKVTDWMIARKQALAYDGAGTDFSADVTGIMVCSADAGGLYGSSTAIAPGTHRVLWAAQRHVGNATGFFLRNYGQVQSSDFIIEDIGPAVHEGGVFNTGGAAVTAVQTYVKTYSATWSTRYGNAGTTSGEMFQGYYSGTWGTQRSMVGFGTQPYTDMGSTAKISKVEVYLYANHWYYNAGGTAHIGVHSNTSSPGSFASAGLTTSVGSWPIAAGKWVTLPSSWNAGFNSGSIYRGITLGGDLGSSTDRTYYGIFDGVGNTHPPMLRITYSK